MAFTAHNVRLDNGTETYPAAGCLLADIGPFRAAKRMLNVAFPDGLYDKSIVDLGCLEGGYATEFARLGMNATGIEVRDSNFQNCLHVKKNVNLPNLAFIKDDVNNIGNYGPFDAIWASGIFYHLDQPKSFMEKAAKACKKIMFIETHFTYASRTPAADSYSLSEICEHDDLKGRWFYEHDDVSDDALNDLKWASWSNRQSFWVQKEYLLNLLNMVGFDIVLEQYDLMPNILLGMDKYYNSLDRGLFVGIKSG